MVSSALAQMQKDTSYLFEVHFTAMKIDPVSCFIEQKGQRKELECWRRIGGKKKTLCQLSCFLEG